MLRGRKLMPATESSQTETYNHCSGNETSFSREPVWSLNLSIVNSHQGDRMSGARVF
jgi:hypothetical protein